MIRRRTVHILLSGLLIVAMAYIQVAQLVHNYHGQHHQTEQVSLKKSPQKGELNCQICDYVLVKKHQQLLPESFLILEVPLRSITEINTAVLTDLPGLSALAFANKGPPQA